MADHSTCLPLSHSSITTTYARIESYVHITPLITSRSLSAIASHSSPDLFLTDDPPPLWGHSSSHPPNVPQFNLYLKLESQQRIGAFKARGAFSAVTHLIEELGLEAVQARGVITHSSGNHAQALALAATTFNVKAWIVMPKISTPSKISGVKAFRNAGAGVEVVFSGSTAREREDVVDRVVAEQAKVNGNQGPILVPPYDHPDIILGQGTTGLEMETQFREVNGEGARFDVVLTPLGGGGLTGGVATWFDHIESGAKEETHIPDPHLDQQEAYTGVNGEPPTSTKPDVYPELSDTPQNLVATCTSSLQSTSSPPPAHKKTLVIGTEPSFQDANDAERSLGAYLSYHNTPHPSVSADPTKPFPSDRPSYPKSHTPDPPSRIPHVSTLTIADGLRTPLGQLNFKILSNPSKIHGIYSVSEEEIKMALKLVMERCKVFVEPSAVVPVAVVLFNDKFRQMVAGLQREEERVTKQRRAWDVGIVISGGNATIESIGRLFCPGLKEKSEKDMNGNRNGETGGVGMEGESVQADRQAGLIGRDGNRRAEDIAG